MRYHLIEQIGHYIIKDKASKSVFHILNNIHMNRHFIEI